MLNKEKNSWELTTIAIAVILSILFFIFLLLFPEFTYLAPIYLLFGMLITAALNIYMNKKMMQRREGHDRV